MKKAFSVLVILFISFQLNAQWVQTNGPGGGYVNCLLLKGANIYAGTRDAGIFLSSNNGTNWVQKNSGLTNYDVYSMTYSGSNIFAGTIGGGVFLSTNNGTNWKQMNNGLTNSKVLALTFNFNGSIIFAGTDSGGVYSSTNNGTNWTQIISGLPANPSVYSLISGFGGKGNVFAGTSNGVYYSSNSGLNWTSIGLAGLKINALAGSGTNLYVGTSGHGVYLSTNNGTNWTNHLTSLTVNSLTISGSDIYAGTQGGGVFSAVINGTSWIQENDGLFNSSVFSLIINGTNIFAGTDGGGIFLSTDSAATWTQTNNGLNSSTIHKLAVNGTNILSSIAGGGVSLSTDNGTNWSAVNNGLTDLFINALATNGNNIYAGSYDYGGVSLSTNNGTNWTPLGLDNYTMLSLIINGTDILAGTTNGVYRSTNNGANWAQIGMLGDPINSFLINGGNIFAGSGCCGVYRSTNNGTNWSQELNGLTNPYEVALAKNENNIYAGTYFGGGVFLSSNNGNNWIQAGLTGSYGIFSLIAGKSYLFAGTTDGVYLSTNNGQSWTQFNTGLGNTYIQSLAIIGSNIFAATSGTGVWKRPLSDFGITTVQLTALIEGFYDNYIPGAMVSDTVTLELHNSTSPYALVESQKGVLNSVGVGFFYFSNAVNGTPYYLVVKHRNSVETWSASPKFFASNVINYYDFTTAQTKAYGNNLIQKGTKWCIFSGDVNQDGYVTGDDYTGVDNDNFKFDYHLVNDVNGDGYVTGDDYTCIDNNNTLFVQRQVPSGNLSVKNVINQHRRLHNN